MGISFDTRPTASFLDDRFDGYRLVFIETPSNPGLYICDMQAVCEAAHAAGAIVADTKAPNGHSDALFGHPDSTRVAQARRRNTRTPFEAWLVHRGLETLELRFERMCGSAGTIATRLTGHPMVEAVRFPGLVSDPSHNLASSQMRRFGFPISLTLRDGYTAERFINGCQMIRPATSFGGVHTSAERRIR